MPLAHLDPFARYSLVFLTLCTAKRRSLLNNPEVHSIFRALWADSAKRNGWRVGRYVIIPDHVHLFTMPDEKKSVTLHQWISVWKSISARQITAKTSAHAPIWQRDYFDRYLRTAESYSDKWDYILNNPVRAKLVIRPDDWPYQGVIHELAH